MKRIILVILLSVFSKFSLAQGMYGFGIGLGYTTAAHSRITPAFETYHLWKITTHWYAGINVSLQKYSFLYDASGGAATLSYGDLVSIRQKSSFLFFNPRVDYGIGYRKYVHVSVLGGPGFAISAGQWMDKHEPLLVTSAGNVGHDTLTYNTSYNVPRTIFRIGVAVSERIPTHGYFNIILTQEFTNLMNKLNYSGPNLTTSYFCFTVGLVHKYPQVWRED